MLDRADAPARKAEPSINTIREKWSPQEAIACSSALTVASEPEGFDAFLAIFVADELDHVPQMLIVGFCNPMRYWFSRG